MGFLIRRSTLLPILGLGKASILSLTVILVYTPFCTEQQPSNSNHCHLDKFLYPKPTRYTPLPTRCVDSCTSYVCVCVCVCSEIFSLSSEWKDLVEGSPSSGAMQPNPTQPKLDTITHTWLHLSDTSLVHTGTRFDRGLRGGTGRLNYCVFESYPVCTPALVLRI